MFRCRLFRLKKQGPIGCRRCCMAGYLGTCLVLNAMITIQLGLFGGAALRHDKLREGTRTSSLAVEAGRVISDGEAMAGLRAAARKSHRVWLPVGVGQRHDKALSCLCSGCRQVAVSTSRALHRARRRKAAPVLIGRLATKGGADLDAGF